MDNPVGAITNLKPKTLAFVVVGGIGAGLLWRHYSGSKNAQANAAVGLNGDLSGVDLSQLALAGNSAGNLSGPLSDVQGSGLGGPNTGTTREVGSINLPVTRWIITIGGVDYMIDDQGNITPVNAAPSVPTTPAKLPPLNNPDQDNGWVRTTERYPGQMGQQVPVFTDGTYMWTQESDRGTIPIA